MQLAERAELLTDLDAWLAEARLGSGSMVLLGGEAGVGKTSVAKAFVNQRPPSWRVLWGDTGRGRGSSSTGASCSGT